MSPCSTDYCRQEPCARAIQRAAGRWHDLMDLERLRKSALDLIPESASKRLSRLKSRAESIVIASRATDGSTDKFINFALTQAARFGEH